MSILVDDTPLLPGVGPANDMVGDRRLVAVQCIDIGRLQSDVVPLPRAGLVGITGQGPIDSNGSSKTTFLAALDLLGMSYAWRPGSGRTGSHARGLVLDIDGARSEVGYVLGWWCRPSGTGGSLTTVARIERSGSTPLRFKVAQGCRLADGTSHEDRVTDAHTTWDELDAGTYSARRYLDVVLGGEPRSAGFVAKRGDLPAEVVSLFTTELERLKPAEIGDDLVQLTGLEQHVESERVGRRDLAGDEHDLRVKQASHQDLLDRALANEADRQRRADALASAQSARMARQGWTARRLVDAVDRVVTIADRRRSLLAEPATLAQQTTIEQLHQRVRQLSDDATLGAEQTRLADQERQARGPADAARETVRSAEVARDTATALLQEREDQRDPGARSDRPVATVERDLDTATDDVEVGRADTHQAGRLVTAAQQRLDVVASDGTEAVRTLRAHGMTAWSLLDDVEVEPGHQAAFDAALARFDDAVVVASGDRDQALHLLADRPGTLVVTGDPVAPPDGLPDGVVTAPGPATGLLAALTGTTRVGPEDVAAFRVPTPDHVIVAGWAHPQVGREARLAAAQSELSDAEHLLADRNDRLTSLRAHRDAVQRELAANQAEADHAVVADRLARAVVALRAARQDAVEPVRVHDEAVDALNRTRARIETRREDLEHAQQVLEQAEQALQANVLAPAAELVTLSRRIPIADLVAAVAAIDAQVAEVDGHVGAANEQGIAIEGNELAIDDLDRVDPDPDACDVLRAMAARVLAAVQGRLDEVAPGLAEDWSATESWRLGSTDALRAAGRHLGVQFEDDRGRRQLRASEHVPAVLAEAWKRHWDDMQREVSRRDPDADELPGSSYLDSWIYDIADAMSSWLSDRVEQDRATAAAEHRRVDRSELELATAQDAVQASRTSYEAHRDAIVVSVEEQFKEVGAAFAARVGSVDGAAAELQVRRLDAEADGPLRWEVTPAWAQGPDQRPVDYRRARPSTAQSKLKTVQLVLAAFSGRAGRMLILDEVAAAYGREHFRIVLSGLHDAAEREQLTVLATLQDSHLGPATPLLEEAVFFRYRGGGHVLNDPTISFLKATSTDADVVAMLERLLNGHRDRSWLPLVDPSSAWDGTSAMAPDDASDLFDDGGSGS